MYKYRGLCLLVKYIYIEYIRTCIFWQMTESLWVCIIFIRLHAANVYYRRDLSHSYGESSVCPGWKFFIRTFERSFLFKSSVVSGHDTILNSVILFDYSRVFADFVFFYLRLFTLTYIFPTWYVIYWEEHVLGKHQSSWALAFSTVIRKSHHKGCYRYDYHPRVSLIYICFL